MNVRFHPQVTLRGFRTLVGLHLGIFTYLCPLIQSMMNYLSAENLSKSYGDRLLFGDLNIGLHKGERRP